VHRHYSNPKKLLALLPTYIGGEFILKKGSGRDTLVFYGKINHITIPDLSKQAIYISSHVAYERHIGCNHDFSEAVRWKEVDVPGGGFEFSYTWFYPQPRHQRLKLESVLVDDESGKKKTSVVHERCWLCSHTDPIYLELFRTMLLQMFLEESVRKESLWKRLRNRIFGAV
jgi:hypothetical protein